MGNDSKLLDELAERLSSLLEDRKKQGTSEQDMQFISSLQEDEVAIHPFELPCEEPERLVEALTASV